MAHLSDAFIAGVTIITDLIILINTFLGGEITARFCLQGFGNAYRRRSHIRLLSLRFKEGCRAKIKPDENARLGGIFRRSWHQLSEDFSL